MAAVSAIDSLKKIKSNEIERYQNLIVTLYESIDFTVCLLKTTIQNVLIELIYYEHLSSERLIELLNPLRFFLKKEEFDKNFQKPENKAIGLGAWHALWTIWTNRIRIGINELEDKLTKDKETLKNIESGFQL